MRTPKLIKQRVEKFISIIDNLYDSFDNPIIIVSNTKSNKESLKSSLANCFRVEYEDRDICDYDWSYDIKTKKYSPPTKTFLEYRDIDGNKYPTIIVGRKLFMTRNLMVTRFNDGSNINTINLGYNNKYDRSDIEIDQPCIYKKYENVFYNFYCLDKNKSLLLPDWRLISKKDMQSIQKSIKRYKIQPSGHINIFNKTYEFPLFNLWFNDYTNNYNYAFPIRCVRDLTPFEIDYFTDLKQ